MVLFRPTGARELALVAQSGWRAWPPRLPEQPIFYPVLTFEYAEKIAREMAKRNPPRTAGGIQHQELWVPAEERSEFNKAIVEDITIVAEYRDGARIR